MGSLAGGKHPENKVAVRVVKEVTVHPDHPKGTSLFLLKGELWSRPGDEWDSAVQMEEGYSGLMKKPGAQTCWTREWMPC